MGWAFVMKKKPKGPPKRSGPPALKAIEAEGKRSFNGKLLPFKEGPFYLAEECKVPIVPITISGAEAVMAGGQLLRR
jgi:hypothetical protein